MKSGLLCKNSVCLRFLNWGAENLYLVEILSALAKGISLPESLRLWIQHRHQNCTDAEVNKTSLESYLGSQPVPSCTWWRPWDPFRIIQSHHIKSFCLFDVCSRFVSANRNVPEHTYMESPSFVGIKSQLSSWVCVSKVVNEALGEENNLFLGSFGERICSKSPHLFHISPELFFHSPWLLSVILDKWHSTSLPTYLPPQKTNPTSFYFICDGIVFLLWLAILWFVKKQSPGACQHLLDTHLKIFTNLFEMPVNCNPFFSMDICKH